MFAKRPIIEDGFYHSFGFPESKRLDEEALHC